LAPIGEGLATLDELKKAFLEALTAVSSHSQDLKRSVENLSDTASSHDYARLTCLRVAETQALKKYLQIQSEFFETLKSDTSQPPANDRGNGPAEIRRSDA